LRECSQLADELICLRSDIDNNKQSMMMNTVRSSSQSMHMERRMLSNGKESYQNSNSKRHSETRNGDESRTVSAVASP
jgi:hypothetical protein